MNENYFPRGFIILATGTGLRQRDKIFASWNDRGWTEEARWRWNSPWILAVSPTRLARTILLGSEIAIEKLGERNRVVLCPSWQKYHILFFPLFYTLTQCKFHIPIKKQKMNDEQNFVVWQRFLYFSWKLKIYRFSLTSTYPKGNHIFPIFSPIVITYIYIYIPSFVRNIKFDL